MTPAALAEPWPSAWFLPLAVLALLAVWRLRRSGLLLAGVLLANAWLWSMTFLPLARPYGLGASRDRLNNLAMVAVVAAEGRPLETLQVGQLHFEPLWHGLVAGLAGGQVERVPGLLQLFSLLTPLGFVLALQAGLRKAAPGEEGGWERALVAGFATLLVTAPLESLGAHDSPWPAMFLLKPNHALGLCLAPLVLAAVARARGWRGRVAAGLVLHLMGWAFVVHMAFVVAGLLVFVLLSWAGRRPERRREALDVGVVVGVNLLAVSPYLVMLLRGYPFLKPLAMHTIASYSAHLLEGLLAGGGLMLAAAAWGGRVLWVRGDRLSRLWLAQALTALAVWTGYLLLSALQMARELDEAYYWLRFHTAILAGIGAWDLARRAAARWPGLQAPAARAALLCGALLPFSLPAWWRPATMDRYFQAALQPLPATLVAPARWLAEHSRPGDVVAGDRDYATWVSALTGRRVLLAALFHTPPAYAEREALERGLLRGDDPRGTRALAAAFGVRFLVVTPRLLAQHGLSLDQLLQRRDLEPGWRAPGRVRAREPLAVLRFRPEAGA